MIHRLLLAGVSAIAIATAAPAFAEDATRAFDIPAQPLSSALLAYSRATDTPVIASMDLLAGKTAPEIKGDMPEGQALAMLLQGTGLKAERGATGSIVVERVSADPQSGSAAGDGADAGTVAALIVTAQKKEEDIQDVPIAISAFTQKSLDAMKIEGGPDLLKAIPNVTFSKTNFTSYNIQIRGIGTQAISVTTDPAVAVAFNSTAFIRNHLFEQEFFDVERVEVLRGPQGTLYGRNATAGVVNVISAKPTDQFGAQFKGEIGNYDSRRLSGWINIPIIGDKLDVRLAGAWTARNGYAFNETTNQPIDGRDLWSGRLSVKFHPIERLTANFVWEHFNENDDRARSTKQLCKKDPGPDTVDGLSITGLGDTSHEGFGGYFGSKYWHSMLSEGCLPTSLYSSDAYETPNGQALPFVFYGAFVSNAGGNSHINNGFLVNQVDPYSSTVQSRNLRRIQSELEPTYKAKADVYELNIDFDLTKSLTLTSQTGYDTDQLLSTEDFNRFNTASGIFANAVGNPAPDRYNFRPALAPNGVYCDPQLGCSQKMVGEDLSREHAKQFSQELRLASHFEGPFNFSVGFNYTRYRTVEDYFVFFNLITLQVQSGNKSSVGDFGHCYDGSPAMADVYVVSPQPSPFFLDYGVVPGLGHVVSALTSNGGCAPYPTVNNGPPQPGTYIDPNPINQINGLGHNYFRSENPYRLNSIAGFGEAYYQVTPDIKLTAGLRWTDDKKRFWNIPSWVFLEGGGYPVESIVNQQWKEWTGRLNADWSPKLAATDQTMIYASYSRGYKGGGANPPGPEATLLASQSYATHPATFEPEFVNAFEVGTKNALLGGALIMNGDVFFYDYKNYQVSQIVDRTSINQNFNATVWGAEFESIWAPSRNLRFNLTLGYEDSSIGKGMKSIDLMDRTAGQPGWIVMKPFVADTSNCIFPAFVVRELIQHQQDGTHACDNAYQSKGMAYFFDHTLSNFGVVGFDPTQSPNDGEGFYKNLEGHELPNTPHWTQSFGAQYTYEVPGQWTATLRGDFYHQSQSFFRVYNDTPYDKLRGWNNLNLSIVAEQPDIGFKAELYVKNVLNSSAITGAFLNSDDTALTTNVFVIDPRIIGISVTKSF